jgi:2-keto-4-pentenoate hydratase/2-oxohepta-3-ene-1,7-dioic acid hydratase in catechol pathway
MRLCHFDRNGTQRVGLYDEKAVFDLSGFAAAQGQAPPQEVVDLLGPDEGAIRRRKDLQKKVDALSDADRAKWIRKTTEIVLRSPIQRPNKFFLLAGNYAAHIEEGGGKALAQRESFPYVFMKPPTTTINHPGAPFYIPKVSPTHIDWELELGVVIGKDCHGVSAGEAAKYIAGYTVVNDISDRHYRPNPERVKRPKDTFFDWLHGKWHDGSAPIGPCICPAEDIGDPQNLKLQLTVNGNVEQDSNTADMIFPVADVIAFITRGITLERGDIISTGTPSGVGSGKNKFLNPGDRVDATIEKIGTLTTPIVG